MLRLVKTQYIIKRLPIKSYYRFRVEFSKTRKTITLQSVRHTMWMCTSDMLDILKYETNRHEPTNTFEFTIYNNNPNNNHHLNNYEIASTFSSAFKHIKMSAFNLRKWTRAMMNEISFVCVRCVGYKFNFRFYSFVIRGKTSTTKTLFGLVSWISW